MCRTKLIEAKGLYKEKEVIVKNVYLRNLRNNLRKAILLAGDSQFLEATQEDRAIMFWPNGDPRPMSVQEKAQSEYLQSVKDKLYFGFNNSICICPVCGAMDKDMSFDYSGKKWFCIDCHKKRKAFHHNYK